jgi:lipopolysaccharide biosynthesis glycosyltransferase
MIRIFIGFDQVESVAYHTLCHSILSQSSEPVSITPINLANFRGFFTRQRDPKQSNEFSFSRFLTPYLCNYEGNAIFMDCDMMLRTDIKELWDLADDKYAVQVVKHDYTPTGASKYLGTVQYQYPKKNWSSVMLFNNSRCKTLTPEYVNTASGLELHQFKWLESEDLIGELSTDWNHLVGEYKPNPDAKNVHWTIGGPYFVEYADVEFADEWRAMNANMTHCTQRSDLETG